MYQTASEMIREALRLLEERQGREALRADIRAGFAAIERGEYEDYDERTTKDEEDPGSMRRYRLSHPAKADLDRIWFREANIETADRFVDTITARFPVLAQHARRGPSAR